MIENIKVKYIHAHGEVNFFKITEGGIDLKDYVDLTEVNESGDYIVGHSESGHHHLLGRESVKVFKKKRPRSEGMEMLYAVVEKATNIKQDAANPHGSQIIEPGQYLIGISREYDPFAQQARRVAD